MEAGGAARRSLLAEADARRDAGDWSGAARAYAAYLAEAPQDWRIWIQHGHCIKEAGDPRGALTSYRRAEAGLPEDADLQVQIGHVLKQDEDWSGARAAYAHALELDPLNEAAWREVRRLLHPSVARTEEETGEFSLLGDLPLVFDLSDLMAWWRGGHRIPTGIQRIQIEITAMALTRGTAAVEVQLAVYHAEAGCWRELPREAFRHLVALARAGGDSEEASWTETLGDVVALLDAAPELGFPEGAWLVNLGSSWSMPGYHAALRAARDRTGLRYAALVHDVGPILMPEHVEPADASRFARWFATIAMEADLLLAVSAATRSEMLRLAESCLPGLPFPPVHVLRPGAPPVPPPAETVHPRAAVLTGEPYILCVGSIESRKDHLFVLNAWLALLRTHGAALPQLLLVGRAGFNAGPALSLLQRAPALAGRVHWLDDVPDSALTGLYRDALFTIYHSQHEGWGLPVTEALAAGKAVVTPAHSGLLEAGQGLALHYAPGSEPEFVALVEKLAFDEAFRSATEARVKAGLKLRSWSRVANDLCSLLSAAQVAPRRMMAPPIGTVLHLGELETARPEPAMAWAERLRTGTGWLAPEDWGCWTRPGRTRLELPLPPDHPTPLRLHLALRGADALRQVALRLGRAARQVLTLPPHAQRFTALDLPEPESVVALTIDTETAEEGRTDIGIGVVAAMICRPDDIAARLNFLERVAFVWPTPG